MQAGKRSFREIVDTSINFIVPVFQRDYKWGTDQCQRLWDDIIRSTSGDAITGHFLGSLVQIDTGRTTPSLGSWLVIDGQQRLTSLTLLVAALRDHIEETGWTGNGGPTPEQLEGQFLKNRYANGEQKYKLSLRRADNAVLHALVDSKDPMDLSSGESDQVRENYHFFRGKLRTPGCDLTALYNGIASLQVVEVVLEIGKDDAQFVFESVNDTGIHLSQSDLVRNYLLMRLEEERQTSLYTEYWSKIEGYFRNLNGQLNDGGFDRFLRYYSALKTNRQSNSVGRIYEEFKQRHSDIQSGDTLEALLQDMLRLAGYDAAISGSGRLNSQRATSVLHSAHRSRNPARLLMLRLCEVYDHLGTMGENDFVEAVSILENYMVRRAFMGWRMQDRSYRQVFERIVPQITNQPPLEVVRREMTEWPGQQHGGLWAFPDDAEFSRRLQAVRLYSDFDYGLCHYILSRLENYGSNEPSPVGEYQIEHIMPQQPGAEWQQMLGDDWERLHSEWLHRLGNLTLTGYNPAMSNRPFHEKKTIPGGFNQSAVRLNQYVREQEVWTEAQMAERGRRLAERALQIWPYPRV